MLNISYVYANLIEISQISGITYKTIEQVPEKIRNEVREILKKKSIEIK